MPADYDAYVADANASIGQRDETDVPTLAVAKAFNCAIWSNDRDFDNLPGVTVYSTAELLARL